MAGIRRILIIVVGLLLIVDASALAYIKLSSGPAPSEEQTKLVFWVDDAGQAKAAVELLKEQGYEAVAKADKRKTPVEADFRVAMSGNKKILDSIAQILRSSGHKDLSYSEDGTKLYCGGFYKQKSQALRVAQRIKAQDQIVFEVVAGSKMVSKPSNKVVLASVPTNMVEDINDLLKTGNVTVNDSTETSLEPKTEDSGSSEE